MKVRSPGNGFDEIRELFKDEESSLLEDLDLSFMINKDTAPGYLFDDLAINDRYNFQFNDQGQPELPSLPLSFGDYDIPGPSTDDFNPPPVDVLHNSNVIQDQNLPSDPNKHKHEDSEPLAGGSGFQGESESFDLDCDIPNGTPTEFGEILDDDPVVKTIVGISSPSPNEIVDQTCFAPIQEKGNDFELCFTQENEASISQVPEIFCSGAHQVDLESESRHIDDLRNLQDANEDPKRTDIDENISMRSSPPTQNHDKSVYANTSLDQRHQQAECFDQNAETPSLDHSQQDATQKSASSSQHLGSSPATQDARPRENLAVKRSVSPSSGGQRKMSFNGEFLENSQLRCSYSREISKKSSEGDARSLQSIESQNISVSQEGSKEMSHSSISRKRKRQEAADSDWAGEVSSKELAKISKSRRYYELDGCSDQGREATSKGDTSHSSWQNSTFSQELPQNFQDSSSSKQSQAPPREKYPRYSPEGVRGSVSPPPTQRRNRHYEYRRDRNISRSTSPYGRDHHRRRYSPRHRHPSRSCSSRRRSPHTRHLSPAFFRRTGLGKPGTCLFVAGFCFSTTERELRRKFSRFGRVRDVRIICDKRSGRSRGYGFLSLERDEEADAAIRAIHKTKWNGRIILVEKSIPK